MFEPIVLSKLLKAKRIAKEYFDKTVVHYEYEPEAQRWLGTKEPVRVSLVLDETSIVGILNDQTFISIDDINFTELKGIGLKSDYSNTLVKQVATRTGILPEVYVDQTEDLIGSSSTVEIVNYADWQHQKPFNVKGFPGCGYDYQIKVRVGESPDSSNYDFHIGGQSLKFPNGPNDSGDIRFSTSNLINCPLWVESIDGTSPNRTANIQIKIPESLDRDLKLICYYGNENAENVSDGKKVFLIFDDFTGDLSGWTSGVYVNEKNGPYAHDVSPGYNTPRTENGSLIIDGQRSSSTSAYEDGVNSGWWGRSVISKDEINAFDFSTGVFSEQAYIPKGIKSPGCIIYNNKLHVIGGVDDTGYVNGLYEIDLDTTTIEFYSISESIYGKSVDINDGKLLLYNDNHILTIEDMTGNTQLGEEKEYNIYVTRSQVDSLELWANNLLNDYLTSGNVIKGSNIEIKHKHKLISKNPKKKLTYIIW